MVEKLSRFIILLLLVVCLITFIAYNGFYLNTRTNEANNPSSLQSRFPKAIIFGVTKCGTGALQFWLSHHPDIAAWEARETQYFNRFWRIGLEGYRKRMKPSYPHQISIDNSPGYFSRPDILPTIQSFNSSIKLLAIIRDPIDRAVSRHFFRMKMGLVPNISIDTLVLTPKYERLLCHHLENSYYWRHFSQWWRYFNRSQIHIVDGENMIKNPAEECAKVEKFLGIKPYLTKKNFVMDPQKGYYCFAGNGSMACLEKKKGSKHPEISEEARDKLVTLLKDDVKQFKDEVTQHFNWYKNYGL